MRKAWFPGERRVSLAWEWDSNGHQASFQAEKKGTVKRRGGAKSKEVMKTIHPSPDVSGMRERKRGFEVWKLSLKCVKGSHGRGSSLQASLFWFTFSALQFHFCFAQAESVYANEIQLKQLDMQQTPACSNVKLKKTQKGLKMSLKMWWWCFMCRWCRSEHRWRHAADHNYHTCRWSHWDLQDDWQRSPGIDLTLLRRLPSTLCSTTDVYVIKQASSLCLKWL